MKWARNQCFVMGSPEQVQYTMTEGQVCNVVEHNLMDLMVGNRGAPGTTILGGVLEYLTCQPSLLCPADGSCTP